MSFITIEDIPLLEDVQVEQAQVDEANLFVERVLISKGINPQEVDPQNPHLKELAKSYAIYRTYLLKHTDRDSPYLEKAKELEKEIKRLSESISAEMLGISRTSGKSFATFRIQRG